MERKTLQPPRPAPRSGVHPIPQPPTSGPPPLNLRYSVDLAFRLPPDTTIRSLECWSSYGCAGDKTSDAYYARAALARGCRYGLNRFGRLVFIYKPKEGHVEHEIQANSATLTRATLVMGPREAETLLRMSRVTR